MKLQTIMYWVTTGALCLIMLFSVGMYFTKTEMVKGFFEHFGYPTYLVIPLAVTKLTGVIAVLQNRIQWIKEWAYAGFFFNLVLASLAHAHVGDKPGASVVGLICLIGSYVLYKRMRK